LILALAALAAGPTAPKKGSPPGDPREKDLIAALPDEDRRWLVEFVAPIILPEERKAYLELTETYQRDDFREKFWERRELPELPWILGPGYRYRYRELRELADSKYDGWRSDAGRLVIRFGEPSEILVPSCTGDELRDGIEVWKYANPPPGLNRHLLLFYRLVGGSPRRLWTLLDGDGLALFYPNSCRGKLVELRWDCEPRPCPPCDKCFFCPDRCAIYRAFEETIARETNSMGALAEKGRLLGEQSVPLEGLASQPDKWATTSKRGAKPIGLSDAQPASSQATANAPAEPPRRLSGAELAERMAALEKRYREWLDIALPLFTEADLMAFVQMSNGDRDAFMASFWTRKKGADELHPARATPEPKATAIGITIQRPTPGP
jgi:GWxTD domain-containing protein